MKKPSLDDLRRYAVARTLFKPTSLKRAVSALAFVQADPIRAPARAQDLTLRHRVLDYRAGDLERLYPRLGLEEDFFVNYGFLPRATQQLMHPRTPRQAWTKGRWAQACEVLEFVRDTGEAHPRDVDRHFDHGKTRNWFGGSSNASTQLLDAMHYRGMVRIARRDGGVRVYAAVPAWVAPANCDATRDAARDATRDATHDATHDALVDIIVEAYAPLPERSLSELVSRLCGGGVPQWRHLRTQVLARAKARIPCADVDGTRWYWPAGESPASRRYAFDDELRLLAPFDPIVWDRRRFEMFWGWAYRFEAYTPPAKRVRGYYALPMLWRGKVIGWASYDERGNASSPRLGHVSGKAPGDTAYRAALQRELQRMAQFLAPR